MGNRLLQDCVINTMNIRDAQLADLPAIVSIYNASIPERMATADLDPIPVESRLRWYEEHSPENHPVWVMETDHQIVGWLSFQPFYDRPAYQATAEISIYVHPTCQGQGIGKKLLNAAINRSPKLGLNTLMALIFAHNVPSIKLFQKFGFQQWGHFPRIANLDGNQRDVVIFGLHLM